MSNRNRYLYELAEDEESKKILRPYCHINKTSLKRANVLEFFLNSCNHWINCPENKLRDIVDLLTEILNVTLLLDDVQDNSRVRGGVLSSHLVYGVPATVAAVQNKLHIILGKLLEFDSRAMDYMISSALKSAAGQGLEIHYRDNSPTYPNEKDYLEFSIIKTSSIFLFGVQLMQLYRNNKDNFSTLIEKLGVFFQLYNDFASLKCEKYWNVKSHYEDITEGKFTLPIIHAIENQPNNSDLIHILKQKTSNMELKKQFLRLMEESGSFDYTRKTLERLRDECLLEIKKMGRNPQLENILEKYLTNLENEYYYIV